MIPKGRVGVNVACFALLAWLYGGDLYDVFRAKSAEVSAITTLPSVPFALALLGLALAAGAATVSGVARKLDATWKGYRVMPIVAVVGLFVDLLVIPRGHASSPLIVAAVEQFEAGAAALGTPAGVTVDRSALEALLPELGPPPFLEKGEAVKAWKLEMRSDCAGPRVEVKGAGAGTLFYCAAGDRSQAWITVVGLPLGQTFGSAQMVTAGGQPIVVMVQRPSAEPAPEPQAPEIPQEAPMYFDADAGNLPPLP